jgi:hypothetical protein
MIGREWPLAGERQGWADSKNRNPMGITVASRVLLALWLGNGSPGVASDKASEPSIGWVRAVVQQETASVALATHVPFVFRTTVSDKTCEGWVRSAKALRAWVVCVNRRPDFRLLKEILAVKDATVLSGYVYAGADPKADDIALKIGGLKGWPRWIGVGVIYRWTTFDLRLLNRAEGKRLSVSALIFGTTTHLD